MMTNSPVASIGPSVIIWALNKGSGSNTARRERHAAAAVLRLVGREPRQHPRPAGVVASAASGLKSRGTFSAFRRLGDTV